MLILQIRRALLPDNAGDFSTLISSIPSTFRPLIHPTLASQAQILGLQPQNLRGADRLRSLNYGLGPPSVVRNGEVFTDGTSLFILSIRNRPRNVRARRILTAPSEEKKVVKVEEEKPWLYLYYIGPELNSERLDVLEKVSNDIFKLTLEPYCYVSKRFDELKAEGRQTSIMPSEEELAGAQILQDRAARTLAVAIKASGGLLVRDLAKQLPPEARDRTAEIQKNLQSGKLIDAEIVVVCGKTQAQTARAPSRSLLEGLSQQGLKCACGRPIANEKIEEALTITEHGRALLDGSRWLTFLLLEELQQIGVPPEMTLIEQQAGGDEMDCLANISGELVFFELKDKEFNLGNAYSFGAKIGIIQPKHPVIFSTEHIGNDAKDHFQRAKLARSARPGEFFSDEEESVEIRYIEGLANLHEGMRRLASEIYSGDAARILDEVLLLASPDSRSVIKAVEDRDQSIK